MKVRSPFLPPLASLFLLLTLGMPLGAQTAGSTDPTTAAKPGATAAPKPTAKPGSTATGTSASTVKPGSTASSDPTTTDSASSLPESYRSISLGMDLETVKKELLGDGLFGYRGERDVSLLPTMNRTLIETSGPSFISRAWFQFYEDKLYVMTFKLDPEKVDYYSMYSSLVKKYGEPTSLDPRKSVWTDDRVTVSLERPLTVKYLGMETFNALLEKSGAEKAMTDILRENFIDEF